MKNLLTGIAETCIYATNLEEAEIFYTEILGLETIMKEEGRHVFFKCGDDMLLLFNPDHTRKKQTDMDGNLVPLHGASGAVHVAFSVQPDAFEKVKKKLKKQDVTIESEISWPNSSQSFYFRDPAGNSLEIITSDMWK